MVECSVCRASYEESRDHCPSCGAESEAHRCARCGQEYEGSDACPACGSLLAPVACDEHPERSAQGRCVFCGRTVCDSVPDGGEPFVCERHRGIALIGGWAQVYSTTTEWEAQLLRENLRAEGLEAQIYSQKDHIYPVDMGELSIVRILVPVWEYADALRIIREHMDSEGEVVFACPACGEPYDAGARTCASCGAGLAD